MTKTALILIYLFLVGIQGYAQNNPPDPDLQKQDVPHGKTSSFDFKTAAFPAAGCAAR